LPSDCTDKELYEIFAPFGAIAPFGVTAVLSEDRMSCRGFGFVNFLEAAGAQSAISTLHGTQMPDGTVLRITVKREGGKKGSKDSGKGI